MRKFVTIAATALTLSLAGFAAPAFADQQYPNRGDRQQSDQYQFQDNDFNDRDDAYRGDNYRGNDRWGNQRFDFGRYEGGFDRWERGWGRGGFGEFQQGRHLNHWRLIRRLERQGYYGVRGLRPSRHGFGWRAFAFTGRGRPVMLRVNPYTGRVIHARYV